MSSHLVLFNNKNELLFGPSETYVKLCIFVYIQHALMKAPTTFFKLTLNLWPYHEFQDLAPHFLAISFKVSNYHG
jgi:hypothetical protein